MSRRALTLLTAASFAFFSALFHGGARADDGNAPAKGKLRIGVYESRAIAVAYAPSRFNPVAEKMAAYKDAKAAGDAAKMKELEAWGADHQQQLHFQGFGRVPVADLLAPLKEQIAALAREQGLAAIAMECTFVGDEVELIDVTDDLVKLYDPNDKTLEHIRELRKLKPVALTQLAKMPADR